MIKRQAILCASTGSPISSALNKNLIFKDSKTAKVRKFCVGLIYKKFRAWYFGGNFLFSKELLPAGITAGMHTVLFPCGPFFASAMKGTVVLQAGLPGTATAGFRAAFQFAAK